MKVIKCETIWRGTRHAQPTVCEQPHTSRCLYDLQSRDDELNVLAAGGLPPELQSPNL